MQSCLELVVGLGSAGEQVVGPSECCLVALREIAVLMIVGDVVDEFFGETGLTGLVETDLSSKPAIGHPGVSETHELLHVDVERTT